MVNLQAELAYTQARLSILQRLPIPSPSQPQITSPTSLNSSSEMPSSTDLMSTYNISMLFDPLQPQQSFTDFTTSCNSLDQELDDGELQALAREFFAKYLPGVRFRS